VLAPENRPSKKDADVIDGRWPLTSNSERLLSTQDTGHGSLAAPHFW
jgi:hypothetical protein